MVLEMIDHLNAHFVLYRGQIFGVLFGGLLTHGPLLALAWVDVAQPRKLDPFAHWIPLEVEHGVYGLNFYPPATLF